MPQIIKAFEVYETTDEYGRRGRTVGYFTDKVQATAQAQGYGWFGSEGTIREVFLYDVDGSTFYVLKQPAPVQINENLIELETRIQANTKAKLLKVFSTEEIKSLGLDPNKL